MIDSKSALAACVAVLSLTPSIAQAVEIPCLTADELTAVVGYAAPSALMAINQRCAANLPADAFLKTGGSALIKRYAANKASTWPVAKATALRIASTVQPDAASMMKLLPDDAIQPTIDNLLQSKMSDSFPLDKCSTVDQMLKLLAPLPAENTAALLPLALAMASGHVGKLTLCPAKPVALAPAPAIKPTNR